MGVVMIARQLVLSCLLVLKIGCAGQQALPAQALSQNDEGIRFLAAGDLETAGARFKLALEYNPHFVEALSNLGLVELELGNFSRARQLLTRARRINQDIAQPHHGLGVLAERSGDDDEASKHYRAALAIDPGFAPARASLARLLFDANLLYHAKLEFEKLTQLAPELPEGHVGLAETLIRLDRRGEAERIITEQTERFPGSPELQLLQARTELRNDLVANAIARLTQLTKREDSTTAQALAWLAVAEVARQRPRHAIGAAKRALQLDRESSVARHAIHLALEQLGDPRADEYK
jgi:tetratricopeptide (TPR) repeat protein